MGDTRTRANTNGASRTATGAPILSRSSLCTTTATGAAATRSSTKTPTANSGKGQSATSSLHLEIFISKLRQRATINISSAVVQSDLKQQRIK